MTFIYWRRPIKSEFYSFNFLFWNIVKLEKFHPPRNLYISVASIFWILPIHFFQYYLSIKNILYKQFIQRHNVLGMHIALWLALVNLIYVLANYLADSYTTTSFYYFSSSTYSAAQHELHIARYYFSFFFLIDFNLKFSSLK